ncbi:alpha/beta hydrolase-fold protein [Leifsonia sp. NPDC080035]|uniref:Alpha/beta hydrolase-fold protein n=1 Tax=Leifsonia sp. NPDC080035 TaxID=3143936 RepID=A0AAU7GH69_9MICO
MPILAWLCLLVGALALFPAVRFVVRAWRFRAGPTVRVVLICQLAALALLVGWALLTPRPDLSGPGWFGIALAAVAVPLALGDAIQSAGGLRVLAAMLTGATALVGVGIGVLTLAPTVATTSIAGQTIPLTEQNLTHGAQLSFHIPPTASGFSARDATLFVPPGWLRNPSTTRPIVMMMMGDPGSPTVFATLDALYTLPQERLDDAPFILAVDQLGGLNKNPPCANSTAGRIETYLSRDVPNWIRSNLPVSDNRSNWGIAGYSHGGECSVYLAAKYPATWSHVISVGGPDKPGAYRWQDLTLPVYFHGNLAAYQKTWPAKVLASTPYTVPMTAVFIAGKLDAQYKPDVQTNATAAEKAGWQVTYWEVPGAEHTRALVPGLAAAYNQFIPEWIASGAIRTDDSRLLCSDDQTPLECGLTRTAGVAGTFAILDLSVLAVFLAVQLMLFFARQQPTDAGRLSGADAAAARPRHRPSAYERDAFPARER